MGLFWVVRGRPPCCPVRARPVETPSLASYRFPVASSNQSSSVGRKATGNRTMPGSVRQSTSLARTGQQGWCGAVQWVRAVRKIQLSLCQGGVLRRREGVFFNLKNSSVFGAVRVVWNNHPVPSGHPFSAGGELEFPSDLSGLSS